MPPTTPPTGAESGPYWQQRLTEARAEMRAGRPDSASRHVAAALQAAGGLMPPIRVLRDEVEEVLASARQLWRRALDALSGRRVVAALADLETLAATAHDVPGPRGESLEDVLADARTSVGRADAAVAGVSDGPSGELTLLEVAAAVVDHAGARDALTRIGVAPARDVRAVPVPGGTRVSWTASTSPGPVDYRVLRILDDGSTRPVGVTGATELEDGGTATAYVVIARRAGIAAREARSDRPDPVPVARAVADPSTTPTARPAQGSPPPAARPVGELVVVPMGRRIRLVHPAPADGATQVRRLPAGTPPPPIGTRVDDPDQLGALVPGMGPGLAIDRRPGPGITEYVVLADGICGAGAAFVDVAPVTDLHVDGGRLRWTWPAGCTETVLAVRPDAPPTSAADPAADVRKVTNTRYDIDGGVPVPAAGHAAVFTCLRSGGRLLTATESPPGARIVIG